MASKNQKFTIPKKAASTELLQEFDPDARQFRELASNINNSLWNSSSGLKVNKIELVNNPVLANEFSEKKQSMQKKLGKSNKDVVEIYGYKLAESHRQAKSVCKNGLITTTNSVTKIDCIGDMNFGVYLSRCADILTRAPPRLKEEYVMVAFKIIKGRVKVIAEQHGSDKVSIEPTPDYDGHFSKDFKKMVNVPHPNAYSRIFDSCQMFFYEFDLNLDTIYVPRPRQCLPYAVVHFSFVPPPVIEKAIVQPQMKKVQPPKPVESEPLPAPKFERINPLAPGSSFSKIVENAQVLWTGKLYNKGVTMTECKIVCYMQNTVKLPLLSDMLSFRMKMRISHLAKFLPKQLFATPPLKSRTSKVLIKDREFLHAEIYPVNRRSTSFARLKSILLINEEALRVKLPEDYNLFILPTCYLTDQLGITDDGYPDVLHLLFTSKITDTRNIQGENSIFFKNAERVRRSRVLEIEKLKLTTPIEHPPPIPDIDTDSISPFHHHSNDDEHNEDPIYFTSQEKVAIRIGIHRMRKAAKEEMMLSGQHFTIETPLPIPQFDHSRKSSHEYPSKQHSVPHHGSPNADFPVRQTNDPRKSSRSRMSQQSSLLAKQNTGNTEAAIAQTRESTINKPLYERGSSYPRDPRQRPTAHREAVSQDLSTQRQKEDRFPNVGDNRKERNSSFMDTRSASWPCEPAYTDTGPVFTDSVIVSESSVMHDSFHRTVQKEQTDIPCRQSDNFDRFHWSRSKYHPLTDAMSHQNVKTTTNLTQKSKPTDPRLAAKGLAANAAPVANTASVYPAYSVDESQCIPFLTPVTAATSKSFQTYATASGEANQSHTADNSEAASYTTDTTVSSTVIPHSGTAINEKNSLNGSIQSDKIVVSSEAPNMRQNVTTNFSESLTNKNGLPVAYREPKQPAKQPGMTCDEPALSITTAAKEPPTAFNVQTEDPISMLPKQLSSEIPMEEQPMLEKHELALISKISEKLKSIKDSTYLLETSSGSGITAVSRNITEETLSLDVSVPSSTSVTSLRTAVDEKAGSVDQEMQEKLDSFYESIAEWNTEKQDESLVQEDKGVVKDGSLELSALPVKQAPVIPVEQTPVISKISRQVDKAMLEDIEITKEQRSVYAEGQKTVSDGADDIVALSDIVKQAVKQTQVASNISRQVDKGKLEDIEITKEQRSVYAEGQKTVSDGADDIVALSDMVKQAVKQTPVTSNISRQVDKAKPEVIEITKEQRSVYAEGQKTNGEDSIKALSDIVKQAVKQTPVASNISRQMDKGKLEDIEITKEQRSVYAEGQKTVSDGADNIKVLSDMVKQAVKQTPVASNISRQVDKAKLEDIEITKEQRSVYAEGQETVSDGADNIKALSDTEKVPSRSEQQNIRSTLYPVYSNGELFYGYEDNSADVEDNLVLHGDKDEINLMTNDVVENKPLHLTTLKKASQASKSDEPFTMFDFHDERAVNRSSIPQEEHSSKGAKKDSTVLEGEHGFVQAPTLHVRFASNKQESVHRKVKDSTKDGNKLMVTVITGKDSANKNEGATLGQKSSVGSQNARVFKLKSEIHESPRASSRIDLRDKLKSSGRYGRDSQADKLSSKSDTEESSGEHDLTLKSVVVLPRRHSSSLTSRTSESETRRSHSKEFKSVYEEGTNSRNSDVVESGISSKFKADWASQLGSKPATRIKQDREVNKRVTRSRSPEVTKERLSSVESLGRRTRDPESLKSHQKSSERTQRSKRKREDEQKSDISVSRRDEGCKEPSKKSLWKGSWDKKVVAGKSEETGRKQASDDNKNKTFADTKSSLARTADQVKATYFSEVREKGGTKGDSLLQTKDINKESSQNESNSIAIDDDSPAMISISEKVLASEVMESASKKTSDSPMNWYDEEELKKFDAVETAAQSASSEIDQSEVAAKDAPEVTKIDEVLPCSNTKQEVTKKGTLDEVVLAEGLIRKEKDGEAKQDANRVGEQTREATEVSEPPSAAATEQLANTHQDKIELVEMEISDDSHTENAIEDISPPRELEIPDQHSKTASIALRKNFTGHDAFQQSASGIMQNLMFSSQNTARIMSMSLVSPPYVETGEETNPRNASFESNQSTDEVDMSTGKQAAEDHGPSSHLETPETRPNPSPPFVESSLENAVAEQQKKSHSNQSQKAPQETDKSTSEDRQVPEDKPAQQTRNGPSGPPPTDRKEVKHSLKTPLDKLVSSPRNKVQGAVTREKPGNTVMRQQRGRTQNRGRVRPVVKVPVKPESRDIPPFMFREEPGVFSEDGSTDSLDNRIYEPVNRNSRGGKRGKLSPIDETKRRSFPASRRPVTRIAGRNTMKRPDHDYKIITERGKRPDRRIMIRNSYDRHLTGYRQGAEGRDNGMDVFYDRDDNRNSHGGNIELERYADDYLDYRDDDERAREFGDRAQPFERRESRYNSSDFDPRYNDGPRFGRNQQPRNNRVPEPRFREGRDERDFSHLRNHRLDTRNDSVGNYDDDYNSNEDDHPYRGRLKPGRAAPLNSSHRATRQVFQQRPKKPVHDSILPLMDSENDGTGNDYGHPRDNSGPLAALHWTHCHRDNDVFDDEDHVTRNTPLDALYRKRKENPRQAKSHTPIRPRQSVEDRKVASNRPFFGGLLNDGERKRMPAPRKRPFRGR